MARTHKPRKSNYLEEKTSLRNIVETLGNILPHDDMDAYNRMVVRLCKKHRLKVKKGKACKAYKTNAGKLINFYKKNGEEYYPTIREISPYYEELPVEIIDLTSDD